jgi:PAS domain S-box-containing protein
MVRGSELPETTGDRASDRSKLWSVRTATGYLLAIAATALAALSRWALVAAFGDMPLFITFYPAVALAALLLGARAALLATILSVLEVEYFFVPPRDSLMPISLNHAVVLGLFAAAGLVVSFMAELLQRARQVEMDQAVERTRAILESISDAFLSLDNDLVVTYFNQAAERVLGRKNADVLGRYLFDAFPEARGSVFDERYHQAVREKSCLSFETFFDVEPLRNWYDVRVYPQPEGISVYFQVITDRKRAEEALRESEAKFRTLHEMSPIAIVLNRLDNGQFLESNQALWDMTGYTEEEFRSLTYWDITPVEYADKEAKQLESLHAVGRYGPYEKEYIRKDGARVPVLLCGVRLVARDGMECICSTVQDITELKEREKALRESESRFRTLFEEEMDGIMLADMDTQQLGMPNPQMCRMLGYSAEEIRDLKVSNLHPPEELPRIMEGLAKQSRGEIAMTPELPVLRKDGRIFYADVIAKPVELEGRRWLLGIFRDVTERKRWQDQLKELNATLEQRVAERTAEAEHRAAQLQRLAAQLTRVEQQERQQLATLLHDHLQQLLVGAKFRLSALRNQPLQERYLQSLRQADELIDDSLKTSRSLTAELSPPILHEGTLAQVLHWLARSAKEKYGLTVTVLADEGADLRVPEMRILVFQAVRELLLNTAKHAGVDRASITLSRKGPDRAQIVVADEGAGFDWAQKAAEAAGGEPGAGLGLFSIRERLELMGGAMEIDSQPRRGTRITLTAPCPLLKGAVFAEAPGGQAVAGGYVAGPAIQPKPQNRNVIRVLLADDHEVVRTGLTRLLQMEPDIEVVGQAADGQEALDAALQIQPDVILMDVSMPRMGGVEATRQIIQQMPSIKIIGLSMHEQEDVAASMKAAGAAAYLTKTSPPETLIAAIRECAGHTAVVQ